MAGEAGPGGEEMFLSHLTVFTGEGILGQVIPSITNKHVFILPRSAQKFPSLHGQGAREPPLHCVGKRGEQVYVTLPGVLA